MKNSTLIIGGLVLAGIGYYLYKKNNSTATIPAGSPGGANTTTNSGVTLGGVINQANSTIAGLKTTANSLAGLFNSVVPPNTDTGATTASTTDSNQAAYQSYID